MDNGRVTFTAEEVVSALYGGILDRVAEPGGLAHHAQLLEEGLGLSDLVRAIRTSPEVSRRLLHSTDLAALGPNIWRGAAVPPDRPMYFLHIMKTGGTALTQALTELAGGRFCLTQIFLDHLAVMPPLALQRAGLVVGHLGVEVLDLLPPDTLTVTVLRDPVERTLSHYAHVLSDPALVEETRGLTLEEFVFEARWRPLSANFQARNLVHTVGVTRAWVDFDPEVALAALGPACPRVTNLPLQSLFEQSPLVRSGPDLLAQGLSRLESIAFVGVADDLDELWSRVAPVWGATAVGPVPRLNVTPRRESAGSTPPSLRAAILEANSVDAALYQHASELAARRRGTASRAALTGVPAAAPAPTPAPRDQIPAQGRRRPALPRGAGGLTWLLGISLLVIIATIDALVRGQVVLIGALVVAPCWALASGRWRPTVAAGGLAVVVATALGVPDGIWDTGEHFALVAVVASVSALAAFSAIATERRQRWRGLADQGSGRGGT